MRSWTVVAAFWPAVRPVCSRFSTREVTNSAWVETVLLFVETCLPRSVRRLLTSRSRRARRGFWGRPAPRRGFFGSPPERGGGGGAPRPERLVFRPERRRREW